MFFDSPGGPSQEFCSGWRRQPHPVIHVFIESTCQYSVCSFPCIRPSSAPSKERAARSTTLAPTTGRAPRSRHRALGSQLDAGFIDINDIIDIFDIIKNLLIFILMLRDVLNNFIF